MTISPAINARIGGAPRGGIAAQVVRACRLLTPRMPSPGLRSSLARGAIAVGVEVVGVTADRLDRAGVVGSVAAAARAVIVGRVWLQAPARVIGVAFAAGGGP